MPTLLDVAHNPDAASYLARQLDARGLRGRCRAIVGMYQDKEYSQVLALLAPFISREDALRIDETRNLLIATFRNPVQKYGDIFRGRLCR